jgi:hypothetical protein
MEVLRIEFLLLQPLGRLRLDSVLGGATRLDAPGGTGGGLSALCCVRIDFGDFVPAVTGLESWIVPLRIVVLVGERSGDDTLGGSRASFVIVVGRVPLKLLERNCIGNGDEREDGLFFASGVVGLGLRSGEVQVLTLGAVFSFCLVDRDEPCCLPLSIRRTSFLLTLFSFFVIVVG